MAWLGGIEGIGQVEKQVERIFNLDIVDEDEPVETDLYSAYIGISQTLHEKSDNEVGQVLQLRVSQSRVEHNIVSRGLLFIVLMNPVMAPKAVSWLSLSIRDSYTEIIESLKLIVNSRRFDRICWTSKSQVCDFKSDDIKYLTDVLV